MKTFYVYILANKYNNVLYIGMTNDLIRRVFEHKEKSAKGFTAKYNCGKLVWFEEHSDRNIALTREKLLKKWNRDWKNQLIEKGNPEWNDLAETFPDSSRAPLKGDPGPPD